MSTRAHGVLDRLEATETYINTHQSSYNFGEVKFYDTIRSTYSTRFPEHTQPFLAFS